MPLTSNHFQLSCYMIRYCVFFLFLFLYSSIQGQLPEYDWRTLVMAEDQWSYFSADIAAPAPNWQLPGFDDSSWLTGPGGIGYEDNDDATIIEPVHSLYLRTSFEITDTSNIMYALLHADYDDAFVAYLNGVEIARSNIGIPGEFHAFDALPRYFHEATIYKGGRPEYYELNKKEIRIALKEGQNTLAIQVVNDGIVSTDLSAAFWFSVGLNVDDDSYRQVPSWFQEPVILTNSNLPIFSIQTNQQNIVDDPRITAELKIFNNDDGDLNDLSDTPTGYDGRISIEIRGSSSQRRFLKKSYAFETQNSDGSNNNVSLLGLPEENDWILYGPYSDKSLLRNDILFKLSGDMGQYAPRTRMCELLIDQKYQGVYVLMEKIKRDTHRVNIAKLKDTDNSGDELTGGYIIKIDKTTGGGTDYWNSHLHFENYQNRNVTFQYHYPKDDDITSQQKDYIQNFIHDFETSLASDLFKDSLEGYRKYMDVKSFIDFFLATELAYNVDGYRLSTFLYKDKDSRDSLLHIGPVWDFNLAFGNGYDCRGQNTTGFMKDYNKDCESSNFQIPFWWDRLLEDVAFQNELNCRWRALRAGPLHLDTVFQYIDQRTLLLEDAQARNFVRWPVLELTLWPNRYHDDTYTGEVTIVKDWIKTRFTWLDENLYGICNNMEIKDPNKLQTLLYPNPTSGTSTLEFYLPLRSKINLQLFDMQGRLLDRLIDKAVGEKGSYLYPIDLSTYPKGIYILRLNAVNESQTIRLIRL